MSARKIVGVSAALALLCSAASASAFCRTTTCDPADEDCGFDADRCQTVGHELYWPTACVMFSVHEAGSPLREIDYEQAKEVISSGFVTWLNGRCDGQEPSIAFQVSIEPAQCDSHEYNVADGNANSWIFIDRDWPYGKTSNTLALTTVTFSVDTGQIYDADVEINAEDNNLTTSNVNVRADLQSIVTHEIGHFIGLAHSPDRDATMYASYRSGDTRLRDLAQDDIDGLCAIYPPGRSTVAQDRCMPRGGFSPDCGENTTTTEGCSSTCAIASTSARADAFGFGAWLGLAALLATRLRRRADGSRVGR